MQITAGERAAVEAYLDRLAHNVRDLAERLEALRSDLHGPPFPVDQRGGQAVSPDHRVRRDVP
jgi:hypothetical protein